MTKEEAIERLNIHKSTSVFVDSIAEAIDMAIEALSAEEKPTKAKEDFRIDDDYKKPPTIPTFAESAEAYKAWTGEEMGGTSDPIRSDLVRRGDVRKAICEVCLDGGSLYNGCKHHWNCPYLTKIGELPTVSADGPHGEWEHTEEVTTMDGLHWHVWRCTNCNRSGNPDMNYCPNCGAKMGGDGE